jgi:hypothetical protein
VSTAVLELISPEHFLQATTSLLHIVRARLHAATKLVNFPSVPSTSIFQTMLSRNLLAYLTIFAFHAGTVGCLVNNYKGEDKEQGLRILVAAVLMIIRLIAPKRGPNGNDMLRAYHEFHIVKVPPYYHRRAHRRVLPHPDRPQESC